MDGIHQYKVIQILTDTCSVLIISSPFLFRGWFFNVMQITDYSHGLLECRGNKYFDSTFLGRCHILVTLIFRIKVGNSSLLSCIVKLGYVYCDTVSRIFICETLNHIRIYNKKYMFDIKVIFFFHA